MYPGIAIGIARKTLNSMRKTTMVSIKEVFDSWGLNMDDYCTYKSQGNYYEFTNGSRLYLIDCSHSHQDPDYHRFGSLQLTRLWIEEGGEISAKAVRNLMAAVGRWKNDVYNLRGKTLITCNPAKNWLYTDWYRPWRDGTLPAHRKFIQALPGDNKIAHERNPNYLKDLIDTLSPDEIERLIYGNWEYENDPRNLVTWDKVCDAFHAEYVTTLPQELPRVSLSADLARQGRDQFVTWLWQGHKVSLLFHEPFSDLKNIEERLRGWEKEYHVPRSRIVADSDGVGGYIGDYMKGIYEFYNGGKPYPEKGRNANKGRKYRDLKTQCAYKLADLINEGKLWIVVEDPDIADTIKAELLATLKVENIDNPEQPRKLLSKKIVKETLNGRSPDYVDPLIYGCVHLVKPRAAGLKSSSERASLV